jgi:hypothetical protein
MNILSKHGAPIERQPTRLTVGDAPPPVAGAPTVGNGTRMWQDRPMSTEPLAWNEQFAGRLVTTESGDATYYIDSGHGLGVAAYVRVRDPRGGKRGVCLGSFRTIEEAKQNCERHFAHGSDVNAAERV